MIRAFKKTGFIDYFVTAVLYDGKNFDEVQQLFNSHLRDFLSLTNSQRPSAHYDYRLIASAALRMTPNNWIVLEKGDIKTYSCPLKDKGFQEVKTDDN